MESSADVEAAKRRLRRALGARRRSVSAAQAREVGDRIARHVIACPAYRAAGVVALHAAKDGEPVLDAVFEDARAQAMRVAFPRCGADGRLAFHVVDALGDLRTGRFGVLEPDPDAPRIDVSSLDLVLLPALAVDRRGRRLGRGGGWYDRTFASAASEPSHEGAARASAVRPGGDAAPRLVAVVHDFQCVERLPGAPHDRRVDGVASESGLRWVGVGPV